MRLSAELSDEAMMKGPEAAFEAWWDPNAPTLMKYLTTKGSQTSWLIYFCLVDFEDFGNLTKHVSNHMKLCIYLICYGVTIF